MQNQLTAPKDATVKAYNEGTPEQRMLLETLFGKQVFGPQWIADLAQACTDLDLDFETVLPYQAPKTKEQEVINAYAALRILAQWFRKGWVPNWDNSKQYKYYPWFDMRAGSGFSFYVYFYNGTYSDVGSRLCFPAAKMAEDFGRQYLELYKVVFTN